MFLYLAIALVLFVLAFARAVGCIDRRYEPELALCLTLAAYVVSFLRWNTGTDWPNYISMFENLRHLDDASAQLWWGPAYSYAAVLVNSIGGSYTAFLALEATILFAVKYHILLKSCAAPLVAIFVLFCVNFYDIYFVRQHIATVFFWAFVYYYYNRRHLLAWSSALVAVAYHYSAAMPIAIVVLTANLEWKRIALVTACVACATFLVLSRLSIGQIESLTTVGSYLGTNWIEVKYTGLSTTLRAYLKMAFWFWVILAGYMWFSKRTEESEYADWSAFCLRSAAGIVLVAAVLVPISEVFARIPEFAAPLFAVVLANYRFQLRSVSVAGAAYLSIAALLFVELVFLYRGFPELYYPIRWAFS